MNIMLPDDPSADELPQIDVDPPLVQTPVIRMQDLEHAASPANRVSNKGVVVEPRLKDDEAVKAGLEQLEVIERRRRNRGTT
jgi:hypothetical protein